jgi:putative heme-binding domain-containing protein
MAAQEVMLQLTKVERKPEAPEALRQAIICAARIGEEAAGVSLPLLDKWSGQTLAGTSAPFAEKLGSYQQWFATTYPQMPPATPPKVETTSRYALEELHAYLGESSTKGDAARGAVVFEKANCIKCHRHGSKGEAIGPDLSTVAQRFTRKEILESVLFPSQVVSDQYSSKLVTTVDGKTLSGIVAPGGGDAIVVLQANGEKTVLAAKDVESTAPTKKSAMPEGLFNSLQLQDVADLFAYLQTGGKRPADLASWPTGRHRQPTATSANADAAARNSRRANTLRKWQRASTGDST